MNTALSILKFLQDSYLMSFVFSSQVMASIITIERVYSLYIKRKSTNDSNPYAVLNNVSHLTNRQLELMIDEMSRKERNILERNHLSLSVLGILAVMAGLVSVVMLLMGAIQPNEFTFMKDLAVSYIKYSMVVGFTSLILFAVFKNRANLLDEKLSKMGLDFYLKHANKSQGV